MRRAGKTLSPEMVNRETLNCGWKGKTKDSLGESSRKLVIYEHLQARGDLSLGKNFGKRGLRWGNRSLETLHRRTTMT